MFIVSQAVMLICDILTNFGGHFIFEKNTIELGMEQIRNQRS